MRRLVAIVALWGLPACTDVHEPPPPPSIRAFASAGNGQVGLVATRLPVDLEVTVLDERDRPQRSVAVAWGSSANGRVEPIDPATNDLGLASAAFVLGDAPGPAEAWALVRADSIPFHFEVLAGPVPPLPDPDVIVPLAFPTFDGSGEVVHPDHVLAPFGSGRYLAITPYPDGNALLELPSLFGEQHWARWIVPPGAPNPVVSAPPLGHLSDPDIVYRPDARDLWLYYRLVDSRNRILLVRSADGVRWDAPREVVSAPNHELLSPSVVYHGPGRWSMWSVNGGAAGCPGIDAWLERRRSTDGLRWSPPERISLSHDGLYPWHVEVQWVEERGEYWALYNAKQSGSCTTPALFIATSADGNSWTPRRTPVLVKGAIPELRDIVYRSTFHFDAASGDVWLWLSGAAFTSGRWTWRGAVMRRHVDQLLAVGRTDPKLLQFEPPPAELTDWP